LRDRSPISDRLAASGYFRASDPGRFGAHQEKVKSNIQYIGREESQMNRRNTHGKQA